MSDKWDISRRLPRGSIPRNDSVLFGIMRPGNRKMAIHVMSHQVKRDAPAPNPGRGFYMGQTFLQVVVQGTSIRLQETFYYIVQNDNKYWSLAAGYKSDGVVLD